MAKTLKVMNARDVALGRLRRAALSLTRVIDQMSESLPSDFWRRVGEENVRKSEQELEDAAIAYAVAKLHE